ncbi:CRAL-TRIO domain-containing protein [Lipomyces oligophaga]|uniref:CRAL-TRIO domain-containing protein n=1 Tax=Lipomyces oligophaga TaxID=45792 RepID=UPI0034CF8045
MAEVPKYFAGLTEEQLTAFKDLKSAVPAVINKVAYSEIYGQDLAVESESTDVIILKYLVANTYDVPAARAQLLESLKWRKEFKPLSAAFEETHDPKFDGLGYITEDTAKPDGPIITWNLYGQAAAKPEIVFGDVDAFLRWRVGVMERGIQLLDFTSSRTTIDQVHDYSNVSFLRMDPNARKASKAAVAVFQSHYPEMLGKKYFVNVPLIMGWMFSAMKLLVSRETMAKFVVLSYGSGLSEYTGDWVPKVYGGKGAALKEMEISPSAPAILEKIETTPTAVPAEQQSAELTEPSEPAEKVASSEQTKAEV